MSVFQGQVTFILQTTCYQLRFDDSLPMYERFPHTPYATSNPQAFDLIECDTNHQKQAMMYCQCDEVDPNDLFLPLIVPMLNVSNHEQK